MSFQVGTREPGLRAGTRARTTAVASGCVAGDSLIPTDRGLLRLADLAHGRPEGELAVLVDRRAGAADYSIREATSGWRVSPPISGTFATPVGAALPAGERETLRLVTDAGHEIVCTADQALLTTAGWIPAGRLVEGRHGLLVQSGPGLFAGPALPFEPPAEVTGPSGRTRQYHFPSAWSADLGYVVGWLTAHGWVRGGERHAQIRFAFGRHQTEPLNRIKQAVNPWYGAAVREAKRPTGGYHLTYYGQTIVEFLEGLGFDNGPSDERRVPSALLAAPREAVGGFLSGLFAAGAGERTSGPAGPWSAPRIAHRSRRLLLETQLLLLQLGIRSKLSLGGRRGPRIIFSHGTTDIRGQRDVRPLFDLTIDSAAERLFAEVLGPLPGPVAASRFPAPVRARAQYPPLYVDDLAAVHPHGPRPVFALAEPLTRSFLANGLIVRSADD